MSAATRSPAELIRLTLRIQMMAALFQGSVLASQQLVSTVARKSLEASDFQVMLITMVLPLCFTFSIWWGGMLRRVRNWRILFPLLGVFGALPMALMSLSTSITVLLFLLTVFFTGQSLYIPLKNRIVQSNYPPGRRGRLFSLVSMVQAGVVLTVSWVLGHWMDAGPDNWRWLFVVIAVSGLIDRCLNGMIPIGGEARLEAQRWGRPDTEETPAAFRFSLLGPLRDAVTELKGNRPFLHWELHFMLYGLSFFMILAVLPGFLVQGMGLSYATIAVGQISLARLGNMVSTNLFGRLHDRTNPATYCGGVFLLLAGYPTVLLMCSLLLGTSSALIWLLYLGFLINGVAMSGVNMAWTMSAMTFARGNDAARYQSIHVSLTGIRGLLGPLLGWATTVLFGWSTAFSLAILLLLIASWLMFRQGRGLRANPGLLQPEQTLVALTPSP
ncbi:MAG: MFS transporter [Calditrichaeota bacterium]|nr:MFS transporter [Candidatus Cloacimonadota bacterium]MCB1047409.1 MFS transporter [Calditrichota bacterium]MCB9473228.1 MFS transporter [Candidatus Delongbacteria bacterium]